MLMKEIWKNSDNICNRGNLWPKDGIDIIRKSGH